MYKREEPDGTTTLVLEQCDLDNSIAMNDISTLVTEEDIRRGDGECYFKQLRDMCKALEQSYLVYPPKMGYTCTRDSISQEEYQQASQSLSDYAEQLKQSTDSRILTLKSQLKHCKNPLQKLNLEREMNKLMREKGRR